MPTTSPQKEAVLAFLNRVVSGQIKTAYDTYLHSDFFHHNAYYKGDRATLMAGMEESGKNFPNKIFAVKKILEEGDTVMTFSSMKLGGEMPEIAVMHMFRFADGKIIELWDVGQQLDPDSPNENGAF